MSTNNTRYNPAEIEDNWYAHWMKHNYFHSEPDEREAFSIVIPPPNVTGVLHMGHMLNNTIQDILTRKARLDGKNACWVPGMDHASIATEAKVVKMLREKGIKKSDLSREEFLSHAWEWKEKYGGIILDQLKKLGASCDWERTRFTMEPKLSEAVVDVFVDLYKKGKIYRGLRMTNWDPEAKTVLSNEEVIHQDENSRLFHVRYQIEGSDDEWITIATTRPETILGDSAIAVHTKDERYAHLKGKKAIVPMVNRAVPIIFDRYVEMEFGTGALKVTPAHDMNDFEIGERHKLEVIDIFNDDGTLSEAAGFYIGEDRFAVRKKIAKDLEASGHMVKIEDYRNSVGRSERTNAVVEPRLKEQWWLDMKDLAATALKAVTDGDVEFHPAHFWNMYNNWLAEDKIKDWCISRQLWWGQQIPAWYYEDHIFVAKNAEQALADAQEKLNNPDLKLEDLHQDEDVVDTWFSSWLWPMSVFDGFENPEEMRYYYPTDVLVTGWDIIYLWVARMVMAGYEYAGDLLGEKLANEKGVKPFKHVYFTGMVRDEKRRKMSKSLGNSPDALALIDAYGADGVRYGMLSSGAAGNDIIFDAPIDPKTKEVLNESQLCMQGMKFCNKMWNALNLIKGLEVKATQENEEIKQTNALAAKWFENKLKQTVAQVDDHFKQFRLSDALMTLYKFIWGDFCSWYLEMTKPPYGEAIDQETLDRTLGFFEQLMTLLHPFMPFVTEEIWHQLKDRKEGEDCIVSRYPAIAEYDQTFVHQIDTAMDIVAKVREARNNNGMKQKEPIALYYEATDSTNQLMAISGLKEMVVKMAYLSGFEPMATELDSSVSFISGTDTFFLEITKKIDTAAEIERLEKEKATVEGFINSVNKKLSNERFVNNAPAVVVDKERQKMSDGQARLKAIIEALDKLN